MRPISLEKHQWQFRLVNGITWLIDGITRLINGINLLINGITRLIGPQPLIRRVRPPSDAMNYPIDAIN